MCDKPYLQFFSTHYVIKEDSGLEFSQFLEGKISNGGEDFEWMVLLIAKQSSGWALDVRSKHRH